MVYSFFMSKLPEFYEEFVSFSCNRMDFILKRLKEKKVKAVVMPIEGRNHIYVVFPQRCYNPMFRIKTVIAHYDRFPESPGANDNSSSVLALIDWAAELNEMPFHNVRLIFTDGEELCANEKASVNSQGAFGLAAVFRRLNLTKDDVYVFDCVGRGTIPIIADVVVPTKTNHNFIKRFSKLKERTENLLKTSCGHFLCLPVGYSDNAGFFANGIPALVITFLPEDEVQKYMENLIAFPELANFVRNGKKSNFCDKSILEEKLPVSWQKLHTPMDNIESLTPESFLIMKKILTNLAQLKSVVV